MFKLFLALPHTLFISLAGIIGFGLLVVVHEFGHFFFCKLFHVKTPTFSVGFGPKLLTKKIGDTEFALSAIPLGGYVEIAGLAEVGQGEQKEAHSTDQTSFSQKPYYQKILILIGGIGFNLLFALGAFWLIFMLGIPKSPLFYPINSVPAIQSIQPGSPAQKAGLQIGDTIIAVNGTSIEQNVQKLTQILHASANTPLSLRIERQEPAQSQATTDTTIPATTSDRAQKIPAILNTLEIVATPNAQGILGITFQAGQLPGYGFFESFKQSLLLTTIVIRNVAGAFASLLKGRNLDQVSGPISIFEATIKGAGQGFSIFLAILALISINLAILNLIPLPITDGGQILFQTIEAIIRREIPLRIKEFIFMACWILFILLALYMSAKDIMRLAGTSLSHPLQALSNFFSKIIHWFKF